MSKSALLVALAVAVLAGALGYNVGERRAFEQFAPPPVIRPDASPPQNEVERRIRDILTETDRLARIHALAGLLRELGPDAAPLVKAAFEPTTLDSGAAELTLIATWWAEFDPEAALQWAAREVQRGDVHATSAAIEAWARRDPEAARAVVERMILPGASAYLVDALVRGWDESGKPGLFEFVRAQPRGQAMQIALASLARRRLLRSGPQATLDWAESIPDDEEETDTFKLNVFRRAAGVVAEVDAPRAAAFATKHRDGPHGHGLVRRVAVRWAREDGAATMAWLSGLAPGKDRTTAVEDSFGVWLTRDEAAAIEWLRQEPDAEWLDPAHTQYAVKLGSDPAVGMQWATDHIRDPARREYTIDQIGRAWYFEDPEGARDWLATRPENVQNLIQRQADQVKAAEERQQRRLLERAAKEREAR